MTGPEPITRRVFLSRSAATGLGIALTGSVAAVFGATAACTAPGQGTGAGPTGGTSPEDLGYGPLVADPEGILALPAGFSYRVVAQSGVTTLESGEPTPSDPDGSANFPRSGGGALLVVNHEVGGDEAHPVPHPDGLVYDPDGGGGTTTLEVDAAGNRVAEYVSLAGTVNNCAGGVTPWGTWLSCEETDETRSKPHGYVFEVDPHDRAANRDPRPVKALGRYPHEAVAVDPDTFVMYLTEDAKDPSGLLYRFTPPASALPLGPGSLRRLGDTDGALEALRALDGDSYVEDLSLATEIGTTYTTEWVPVPDRDAAETPTRQQDYPRPITRARKLEGAWWGDGGAYVVSSYAREESPVAHDGQVWFLDPGAGTMRLVLRFAQTSDTDGKPDGPDNITVSPFGGVMIAEDGEGANHLVGTTTSGKAFFFARNETPEGGEFTGPTMTPDGSTMFANIQGDGGDTGPGYVLAITGPFRTLA